MEDSKWWIIKQSSELERFSELFICRLGQALGLPMADYHDENGTIKSPDFTNGVSVNYESATGLVGSDEDYDLNFNVFWKISPEIAKQYLQIIYLDTICFNMDRHTLNYGVLRDVENGNILSMAPNFDNNIALFARGVPSNLARQNDRLISLFCELLEKDSRALEIAKRLPTPSREMIGQCIEQITIPVDHRAVCDFVMNGSDQIQECILKLSQQAGMEMR